MMRSLFLIACLFGFVCEANAQGRRGRRVVIVPQYASQSISQEVKESCSDALDEVNRTRAERGLSPFIRDPLLCKAAFEAAKQRCVRSLSGHLENDFSCLPSGASATSAGCGAWQPGTGWGTCCTYDNYTYAGAAWAIGTDGVRYMHLFVR